MTRSLVCLVLMAGIALGVPVTWRFQATFNDGGALTGFFVFNADTNTATDWDIVATAGSALAAFEYTPANSQHRGLTCVTDFPFPSNPQLPDTSIVHLILVS